MKICIFSDTHFGHASGTEMEQDPYEAVKEALGFDSDAILIPGDLFDVRVPTSESLAKAMELLAIPKLQDSQAKIESETSPLAKKGKPVIAIHGNHERRAKGLVNPVQVLEKAGFLVHLHCSNIILSKNPEKIAIHGMSWIPDQFAESALKEWNPKPLPEHFNILVLHQNLSGLLYAPHLIPVEALPKGFDLYINGHVHEPSQNQVHGKPLIVPGSSVPTQLKEESEKPKGFYIIDTQTQEIQFHEFKTQRPVIYIEHTGTQEDLENKIQERLSSLKSSKKPLLRIKLKKPVKRNEIRIKFSDKAIVSFRKGYEEEKPEMKTIEEHKLSVNELGLKLLKENLEKAGLDPEKFSEVFELLLEKQQEKAESRSREAIKS